MRAEYLVLRPLKVIDAEVHFQVNEAMTHTVMAVTAAITAPPVDVRTFI